MPSRSEYREDKQQQKKRKNKKQLIIIVSILAALFLIYVGALKYQEYASAKEEKQKHTAFPPRPQNT